MGPESKYVWQKIRKDLPGLWIRIEALGAFGIPDCIYIYKGRVGWVELKYLPSWPARESTRTKLKVKPKQSHFMREWFSHGGRGYLLARIADQWLIVQGDQLGDLTRKEWEERAVLNYKLCINMDALAKVL